MMMMMIPTFLIKQLRPRMTMTTVNLDPKIQIPLLIVLLGHESQGLQNLRLFKGTKNLSI
jgi:hypothetical protein